MVDDFTVVEVVAIDELEELDVQVPPTGLQPAPQ